LSNYEVYSLLQEMEHKQLEQTRAIMATKKEENLEDQYNGPNYVVPEEVAENVRSIQVEVSQSTIVFLSNSRYICNILIC
jgi:hypothetical protein